MISLQSVVGTFPGYVVVFLALALLTCQIAVLSLLVQKKQPLRRFIPALLNFLAAFILLVAILDTYSIFMNFTYNTDIFYGLEQALYDVPWIVYLILELFSAGIICLYAVFLMRWRKMQISPDAIHETVDLLPTGLLVSDKAGTVLLSNIKMTQLCRELTGELLNDAERFWDNIEKTAEDHLVCAPQGTTWQFERDTLAADGQEYSQITAADMTQQYRITEELTRKNRQLQTAQERMKAVAARERSLVAAREVMKARTTVHNQMGGVLLAGKYYLDHPENMNEEELLHLLEYNNNFLLGEAEQPEKVQDPLEESLLLARKINVNVEIQGNLPEDKTIRNIIAQAIEQCAANTARHAGGDHLTIVINETDSVITAAFSNNGKAPDRPVVETGGLAALRKTVEEAGGIMTVESAPVFLLTIALQKY